MAAPTGENVTDSAGRMSWPGVGVMGPPPPTARDIAQPASATVQHYYHQPEPSAQQGWSDRIAPVCGARESAPSNPAAAAGVFEAAWPFPCICRSCQSASNTPAAAAGL